MSLICPFHIISPNGDKKQGCVCTALSVVMVTSDVTPGLVLWKGTYEGHAYVPHMSLSTELAPMETKGTGLCLHSLKRCDGNIRCNPRVSPEERDI